MMQPAGMGVARVNGKSGVGAYQSVTSTSTEPYNRLLLWCE